MSRDLLLRLFQQQDLPSVLDLWTEGWSRTIPAIDFAARRPWLEDRLEEHIRAGANVTVAEARPHTILGVIVVDPASGQIDQIAVAPAEWGTGVGRLLLEHAKSLRPEGLSLDVNLDNPRAIRFYEREGFRRVGGGPQPALGPVHPPLSLALSALHSAARSIPSAAAPASNCSRARRA